MLHSYIRIATSHSNVRNIKLGTNHSHDNNRTNTATATLTEHDTTLKSTFARTCAHTHAHPKPHITIRKSYCDTAHKHVCLVAHLGLWFDTLSSSLEHNLWTIQLPCLPSHCNIVLQFLTIVVEVSLAPLMSCFWNSLPTNTAPFNTHVLSRHSQSFLTSRN